MSRSESGGTSNGPAPAAQAGAQAANGRPGRLRGKVLRVAAVLLAAAATCGFLYWLHARQFEDTDDAFVDGDVVPISAKVPGLVKTVHAMDNMDLRAGDLLLEIDPRDFQARLEQAKAALAAAAARREVAVTNVELVRANTAATLAEAQAGVDLAAAAVEAAQAQLASVRSDVEAAQAEATRHGADLKRYQSLDARAVSKQQLDAALAASESADAQLAAARKRASAAEAQVGEAKARVAQAKGVLQAAGTAPQQVASAVAQQHDAQGAVEQAQAAVDAAQLDLSYTTISAPVSGRVTRKQVEPGQYVEVGQTLLSLVPRTVWVTANFKETQITHMHPGQPVDILVDAYPSLTFHGHVDSIQAGSGARFSLLPPENATGNYVKVIQRIPVKIVFDGDPGERRLLAPGMSVVPRVHVAAGEAPPTNPASEPSSQGKPPL